MNNPSIYRNKQPKDAGFIFIRRKRDGGGSRNSAFPRENKVRCGKKHAIFLATNLPPGVLKPLVVVL